MQCLELERFVEYIIYHRTLFDKTNTEPSSHGYTKDLLYWLLAMCRGPGIASFNGETTTSRQSFVKVSPFLYGLCQTV